MPADPITAALVSSILSSVVQGVLTPSPPPPPPAGLVRHLPLESKRGVMSPPVDGRVNIDGRAYLLSPGAIFRNEINLAIPPTMMQAPAWVRFQTDAMGAVYRVWILSAAEVALSDPSRP